MKKLMITSVVVLCVFMHMHAMNGNKQGKTRRKSFKIATQKNGEWQKKSYKSSRLRKRNSGAFTVATKLPQVRHLNKSGSAKLPQTLDTIDGLEDKKK